MALITMITLLVEVHVYGDGTVQKCLRSQHVYQWPALLMNLVSLYLQCLLLRQL